MNKYVYRNVKTNKVEFETYAKDIMVADQQFEICHKYHPSKNSYISLIVERQDVTASPSSNNKKHHQQQRH